MAINDRKYKANRTRIINKTISNMMELGTYKVEFAIVVERYAELRMQYDMLKERWYDDGCAITEEYTNKAGATNTRKNTIYATMEAVRKELIDLENILGLTPKGLKAIKTNGLKTTKKSALDKALENL